MNPTRRFSILVNILSVTGLALLLFGPPARAQDNICPRPVTAEALTGQFRLLSWKETEYVVQHEPGMKKVYDRIPPNYQAQIQADPRAFPWDRVTANRDQATKERVADLIRDARLQSVADTLASLKWTTLREILARDDQLKAAAQRPKGTPLEAAQRDPRGFDWKTLFAQRDTCELTTLKQHIEAIGVATK